MNYIDMSDKLHTDPSKNEGSVSSSLRNILSTNKGSMPGHPEFGSGISKYLFELLDPLTSQLIKEEVIYAINRWEPRVIINNIDVIEDTDYNRLLIKLKYTIKSDAENMERNFIYRVQK